MAEEIEVSTNNPVLVIYERASDGNLAVELPQEHDTPDLELYGFLKIYLDIMEDSLKEVLTPIDDEDKVI